MTMHAQGLLDGLSDAAPHLEYFFQFSELSTKVRNALSTAGNFMTSSERPSVEPILEKETSPAVLGGREFWKCFGSLKCLELLGLGHPSRTLEGNSRKRSRAFPGSFRNFFREVPAVVWGWPIKRHFLKRNLTLSELQGQRSNEHTEATTNITAWKNPKGTLPKGTARKFNLNKFLKFK